MWRIRELKGAASLQPHALSSAVVVDTADGPTVRATVQVVSATSGENLQLLQAVFTFTADGQRIKRQLVW